MKGSITIEDTIGLLAVIIITILFFSQIFPTIFSFIIEQFSEASAENVARQLSNLITISGAAPYKTEINYTPTNKFVYKASIQTKYLTIVPKFDVSYAEKSSSTQPFAVDLADHEFNDVNSFNVRKYLFEGESKYDIFASKE
jgi:hypothetical protein